MSLAALVPGTIDGDDGRILARGPETPIRTTLDRTSRGNRDAVQGNADGRRNHDRPGGRHRLGSAGRGRSDLVGSGTSPGDRRAGPASADRSSARAARARSDAGTNTLPRRDRGQDDPICARRVARSPNRWLIAGAAGSDPGRDSSTRAGRHPSAPGAADTNTGAWCHCDAERNADADCYADVERNANAERNPNAHTAADRHPDRTANPNADGSTDAGSDSRPDAKPDARADT